MKKETWKTIRRWFAVGALTILMVGTTFELSNNILAQTTGYRFGPQGIIFQGANSGVCWEPSFNAGPDSCILRTQVGDAGFNLGNINQGEATLANAPVAALATATTGGTIPNGTSYRFGIRYVTINNGTTIITAAQEATQTTTGSGTSTITVTAPLAAAGAAGWVADATNASGVGGGNATLTELTQPITTTVCAGAFAVNGPAGPGTGTVVCPFGTNAVFTSLVFTPTTVFTPNIPGSGPTFVTGVATPTLNSAAFPAGLPELVCNLLPQTADVTITTIQALGTCPLAANIQNSEGRVLHIVGHGFYTSGAQTGTLTISLTEGGITPMTVTSAAIITGGQTNAQFKFDYILTTSFTGTAGTLEGHGTLFVNLATAANGNILSVYEDQITAASSAINLTVANSLVANITMSSSTTSAQLRDMQVYMEN